MNQINYQPIRDRIEQYKNLVLDNQLVDEVYKWEFVKNNFGRPDLNAGDFENEIKEITRTNLLYKLSSATLMHMVKADPDSLKELLSNLFDEARDLNERVKDYIQGSEKLYDSIKGKQSDSSFQDERVIGLLLTLRNPEKYTFFKDSFYQKLCNELGEKPRSKGKKLSHYYDFVEDLIENVISQDEELIKLVQSALPEGAYTDPNYRLLTQDFLYQIFDGKAKSVVNEPPGIELVDDNVGCWWINANPKYWDLSSHPPGSLQTYTTHTQKGSKRRIYKYFEKVRPGDRMIGYETTPKKRVVARLVVTRGMHLDEEDQESIEFRVDAFYPSQPNWDELQQDQLLADAEVFSNNQGSLFRLSQKEYERIEQIALGKHVSRESYNLSNAAENNLLDENWLKETLDLWKVKKNLVLQGPPGTGKSFVAERLAWLLMGQKDPTRLHMVQFHPSYSYEDFIEGYRPDGNAGFELQPGHFLKFCRRAEAEPDKPYVFIIDEINRGNLGKVFGEVMLGIEADKRGKPIHLQYSSDGAFALPANVYLIGTMNTADRSLAVVDYALRRRFVFKTLVPEFGDRFRSFLNNLNVIDSSISRIQAMMRDVNKLIRDDHSLGIGFTIGHSYFCIPPSDRESQKQWLSNVLLYEIVPLLEEYWFDQPEQLSKAKNILGL